jgi:hypothetical protein
LLKMCVLYLFKSSRNLNVVGDWFTCLTKYFWTINQVMTKTPV